MCWGSMQITKKKNLHNTELLKDLSISNVVTEN
jgi:hypothetical protein